MPNLSGLDFDVLPLSYVYEFCIDSCSQCHFLYWDILDYWTK